MRFFADFQPLWVKTTKSLVPGWILVFVLKIGFLASLAYATTAASTRMEFFWNSVNEREFSAARDGVDVEIAKRSLLRRHH